MSDHFGTLCIKGLSAVPRLYWNTTTASISWFFTAFHIFTIFLLYCLFSVCLLIRLIFKSCEESRKNNLRLNYIVLLRIIRLESLSSNPTKCTNILKHLVDFCGRIVWVCLTILLNWCLTLFRMGLFGAAHGWGVKRSPTLKSVTHILQ